MFGHDEDCICQKCIIEDMDRHLAETGVEIKFASYETPSGAIEGTRTRYAKPGQSCGTGVVRLVSPKQVKFIKSLFASRDTSKLVRLPGSEDIEKMSLRGARDLIDRLLACPEKPNYVPQATSAQTAYIKSLCERKGMPDLSGDIFTRDGASKAISMLLKLSDKPREVAPVEPKAELTVGIYRHADGRIVQVKPNRAGTRMYGKLYHAESKSWEYAPGLLAGLTAGNRMTIEECQALSVEMGSCCLCGRELTATVDGVPPAQRYIGPICASKLG